MSLKTDKALTITSTIAAVITAIILITLAADIVSAIEKRSNLGNNQTETLKIFSFVFGMWFLPGVIMSFVYPLYLRRRYFGKSQSYLLEIIMLIVTAQTIFTFLAVKSL